MTSYGPRRPTRYAAMIVLPCPGRNACPAPSSYGERDGEQPEQDSEVPGPDDVVERDGEGVQFAHREPGHRTSSTTTARSPPKSWAGASRVGNARRSWGCWRRWPAGGRRTRRPPCTACAARDRRRRRRGRTRGLRPVSYTHLTL